MDNTERQLTAALSVIQWPIKFGSVKVQLRDGKVTLVTVEQTIKVD